MTPSHDTAALSIVLPASNEEGQIGACLKAVLESEPLSGGGVVQCIVVANGCKDATADVARGFENAFATRGWRVQVIDLEQGGKLNALNTGDTAVTAPIRAYLDADVIVSPPLLAQLADVLNTDAPRYASGQCVIAPPRSLVSRAYRRIYRQVPFMTTGVPGCGLFAVNAAGRARWAEFPDIISDDTFVRLCFAPDERVSVSASYSWPIVEGLGNLIRVRRRQDKGVQEIRAMYPHLLANDDKPAFPAVRKLGMALRDPLGFAAYSGVAALVKLTAGQAQGWSRGR